MATPISEKVLDKAFVALVSLFCFMLIWAGSVSADPVKLRNSDEFELLRGGVDDTIINIGNVKFDQGDAHLSCDSSIWVVDKRLLMWGNVNYREGSRSLFSDTLIYDLVDSIMYATGHVIMKEDQSDILGDSLKYVVADSTLYVTGDSVIITSVTDSMWAVGKEAFIDRANGRLELLTDARVVFGYPDTSANRSLSALYIRYEYNSATAVAQEDVVLLEGDSKATGDCAIIERNAGRVRLYEGATLDWLGNFVSGEFISIRSFLGKPERIDVYGDGVALFTEVDSSAQLDSLLEVGALEDSLSLSEALVSADSQLLDSSEVETPLAELVDSIGFVDSMALVATDSLLLDTTQADSTLLDSTTLESNLLDSNLLASLPDTAITSALPEIPGKRITSKITGAHLAFMFADGLLRRADAFGQAYSYYTPTPLPGEAQITNTASGDSIQLYVEDEQLSEVKAFGSVVGDYIEDRSALRGAARSSSAPIVDTIKYNGERVAFNLEDSIITLTGFAGVIQGPMSLSADSILYSTGERLVKAYALQADTSFQLDSLDSDEEVSVAHGPTTANNEGKGADSSTDDEEVYEGVERYAETGEDEPYLGTVTLKDGTQDVDGEYIEFSLATRKGLIIQSSSAYQGAYYTGAELYRVEDDVFLVDGGTYTTCDYESPHFHFWSKHMKMIRGNKMIAKPVVFFIEKIPIFALPFYVFPLEQGRRSGILNFRFGNFNRGGRFLANLGYYWAASEYWDIQSWMDYYETSGPAFSTQMRYNKRYSFSGNFGASVAFTSDFNRQTFLETKSKRWRINFNHRQTISPTFNLNASGNFLSDSRYFTDFTDNLNDRLNRTLRSQVNFSKRLGRSSLSGSYVFDENLDGDKRKTETFPNLSFSMPAVQVFGSAAAGEEKKWYHSIRMGYSSTLRHTSEGRDDDSTTVSLTDTTITIDTTISVTFDTTIDTSSNISILALDTTFFRTKRAITTYRHGTSVGPNFTILKYFPVSFAVRYNETWFKVDETNQSRDAGILTNRFYRTYTASASAGLSTHLYGTVRPNLFGLRGIRHEVNPSVSYSYTPNIRFDQETLAAAKFVGAGSVTNRSQLINFSVRNVFEVKVGSEESSKKITLLTLNSSLSYNPEATQRRWSSMSTNFQSSFIRRVTMSGSMVHSFYAKGGLQSFLINTAFSTSGNFGEFRSFGPDLVGANAGSVSPSGGGGSLLGNAAKSRTWSFSVRHTFSQVKGSTLKRNFMSLNALLQLTPNMSITYTQSYDIFNKNTVNRHLRIYRILHRWEGVFDWTPSGSNKGFSFRINVIDLPDIKFEKSLTSSLGRQLIQN